MTYDDFSKIGLIEEEEDDDKTELLIAPYKDEGAIMAKLDK